MVYGGLGVSGDVPGYFRRLGEGIIAIENPVNQRGTVLKPRIRISYGYIAIHHQEQTDRDDP